jgi:hypothetical protein
VPDALGMDLELAEIFPALQTISGILQIKDILTLR